MADQEAESSTTSPEKRQRVEEGESSSPDIGPHNEEAATAADEEEEEEASETEEEEEPVHRLGRFRSYHAPLVAPHQEYTGHRNETTVKDVNFAFGDDSYVVSGSDDGNWFVWDTATADLVGIFKGDSSGESTLSVISFR